MREIGILILAWMLFGIVSAVVARKKGRSGCAWFSLGLLLGPIGLLRAYALPSEKKPAAAPAPAAPLTTCPSCGAPIPRGEGRCPACEKRAPRTRITSPGISGDHWACPRCGASNSRKLSRCGNCGYSEE